jgi:hypothetical protein
MMDSCSPDSSALKTEATWSAAQSTTIEAITDLLNQPQMMMSVGKSVEYFAGDTEVPGENIPQSRFVHHKSHMTLNPGHRGGKSATNRIGYAKAKAPCFSRSFDQF